MPLVAGPFPACRRFGCGKLGEQTTGMENGRPLTNVRKALVSPNGVGPANRWGETAKWNPEGKGQHAETPLS